MYHTILCTCDLKTAIQKVNYALMCSGCSVCTTSCRALDVTAPSSEGSFSALTKAFGSFVFFLFTCTFKPSEIMPYHLCTYMYIKIGLAHKLRYGQTLPIIDVWSYFVKQARIKMAKVATQCEKKTQQKLLSWRNLHSLN